MFADLPNPPAPPVLSYAPADSLPRSRACRLSLVCAIAAAGIYAGLVLFSRLVVWPAYRRMLISSVRPSPAYQRYNSCKAIAVGLFLVLLALLTVGIISALVALFREPASRRRAVLALGACLAVLAALAVTS